MLVPFSPGSAERESSYMKWRESEYVALSPMVTCEFPFRDARGPDIVSPRRRNIYATFLVLSTISDYSNDKERDHMGFRYIEPLLWWQGFGIKSIDSMTPSRIPTARSCTYRSKQPKTTSSLSGKSSPKVSYWWAPLQMILLRTANVFASRSFRKKKDER